MYIHAHIKKVKIEVCSDPKKYQVCFGRFTDSREREKRTATINATKHI